MASLADGGDGYLEYREKLDRQIEADKRNKEKKKEKQMKKLLDREITVKGYRQVSKTLGHFLPQMIQGDVILQSLMAGVNPGECILHLQTVEDTRRVSIENTGPPQLINDDEKNFLVTMSKNSKMNEYEVLGRVQVMVKKHGKAIVHVTHPDQILWALQAYNLLMSCGDSHIQVGEINSYVYRHPTTGRTYFHLYFDCSSKI